MWHDFLTNEQLPVHKWTHYIPVYEQLLTRYKNRSCTILEIGCSKGGSLQMWKRFLGPYALIVGIDIDPSCKSLEEEQIAIEIGSQNDENFLKDILAMYGTFDVIIDDGSHIMKDISTAFHILFPPLAADGVYIVEDLHTAYWGDYGGGLNHPDSFIEFTKTAIDAMHGSYIRDSSTIEGILLQVAQSTRSIMILDSIIAYEKGRRIKKRALMIGESNPTNNIINELTFQ